MRALQHDIQQILDSDGVIVRRDHPKLRGAIDWLIRNGGCQLLLDSRAEPWSKAERLFHSLLRDAGITGWRANRPVVLADSTYYVDVVFRKLKLAIEIDGRLHHTGAEVLRATAGDRTSLS